MERNWICRLVLIAVCVFLALPGTVLALDVDIKPGNTEEDAPFNMRSQGVTPVVIVGSEDLNVLEITSVVISTIDGIDVLEEIYPVKGAYECVGHWELVQAYDESNQPIYGEDGEPVYQNVFVPDDDLLDLVIHFDTQSIANGIKSVLGESNIVPGQIVNLGFTAEPGTLVGDDTIRILMGQKGRPEGKGPENKPYDNGQKGKPEGKEKKSKPEKKS